MRSRSAPACSHRSSAARRFVWPLPSTGRGRSPTISMRRSSSSHGCPGYWPLRSSAAGCRSPVSCFRRCCGIRSHRRTRWAFRQARRSGRYSRLPSTSTFHCWVSPRSLASFAGSFGALGIVYALSVVRRRGTSPWCCCWPGDADGAPRRRRAVCPASPTSPRRFRRCGG